MNAGHPLAGALAFPFTGCDSRSLGERVTCRMVQQPAVYTHGQHESVLRSHRCRTAANSAAYLLPHIYTRARRARRRLRPRHDHRRPGRPGRPAGSTVRCGHCPRKRSTRPGGAGWAIAMWTSPSADVHALDFPDDTFDVVHAHQVLQHVGRPGGRPARAAAGLPPGWRGGGPRRRLRRDDLVPQEPGTGRRGWRCTATRSRANGGEPDAGRRLLAWARAAGFTDVTAVRVHLVLRHPGRAAVVGRHVGRPRSVDSAIGRQAIEPTATPPPDELAAHRRTAGAAGRPTTDGWFAILHGEVIARP